MSVIVKVLDRIDSGEPPFVFGDASQPYDFVHVEDVAWANLLALKSDATDVFLNIGTAVPTAISELVERLPALTRGDLHAEYVSDEQMFVRNRVGSTEAAEKAIGFRATVALDEGLRSLLPAAKSAG